MRTVVLCIFIFLSFMFKKITSKGIPEVDIIVAPGGFKGIYMFGICHYVKNHFCLEHKKVAGFSCGSLNALFLKIRPELDHKYLKKMFEINQKTSMKRLLRDVLQKHRTIFTKDDFKLEDVRIGVTTIKGVELFQDFLSLDDAIRCCKASCFVPFITWNDIFVVYKNRLTLDGGVFFKALDINKNTLVIRSSMFGRYKDNIPAGFIKPNCSYYQLYLNGYNDARKNHAYFKQFLMEKPPQTQPQAD